MFRNLAKTAIGPKPEEMEWREYRMMLKYAEKKLRDWTVNAVLVIVMITLSIMMLYATARAVRIEESGHYAPDSINGYHWHVDGDCAICE